MENQMLEKNEELEKEITKSEVNARWILKRVHIHDTDHGGIFSLSSGSQGSGKTSVMLSFMDYALRHHSEEKVFWSNCYFAPLQFSKIGAGRYHIMVKQDSGVTFHDRNNKLKKIDPPVTYFSDLNDLYDKALPGLCNAVFFGNRLEWMQFIHYLRSTGEWTHVFFDELSEISPSFTNGKLWHDIGDFAIDMKEIRKCMMCVHANSQAISDIDHRVLTKVMLRIFLPGAVATKHSRLEQKALDNLEENHRIGNQGYLEYSGKFGKSRFRDIYKPTIESWEARYEEG